MAIPFDTDRYHEPVSERATAPVDVLVREAVDAFWATLPPEVRRRYAVQEELAAPTYLQAAAGKVNPEFVISSRQGSSIYEQEALAGAPERLEWSQEHLALTAIRRIVRPDIVQYGDEGDFTRIEQMADRGHWYDSKLAILQHLAEQHPERGFVFVDDLPFPASIDPQHRQVRGVALRGARFSL